MKPIITINMVVLNGEKYIRHCLDSILAQTYPHELIEINILDNGSSDRTKEIINYFKEKTPDLKFSKFNLIELEQNLGMWPGQEKLLDDSSGKYILAIAVDIILDKDFIKNCVEIAESDTKIGAIQAKILNFEISKPAADADIIGTCGFEIFRSRRIVNIGHGQKDMGQFNEEKEIFATEGAVPFLRRETIEDCRINGNFIDFDYFWYGDDLDFAWRMTLLGWKQIYSPKVIAWHDRQTTKTLRTTIFDFIRIRQRIPIKKRILDWQNVRFTIVKNDYIINILKDLPWILMREIPLLGYMILFEFKVLMDLPRFIKLMPKMLSRRKEIMARAKVSPHDFRTWFR